MSHQGQLFPTEQVWPDGFVYRPDFLSRTEEAKILEQIQGEMFKAVDFHGYTAKRRAAEYGLAYDFGSQRTTATKAFPEFLLKLRAHVAAFAGLESSELVEGMILEYPPEAPIGWHRDAPQFGVVAGISLLSSARMRLRPYSAQGKILSLTLESRSIYVLRGSARWQWQHCIAPVERLRYSIVFRTLRQKERTEGSAPA